MASCKECIHFDVCMDYTSLKDSESAQNFNETDVLCDHFKRAADVILPPFNIGDIVWYELYGEIKSAVVYSCGGYLTRRGFVITDANAKSEQGLEVAFGEKSIGKTVFLTRAEAEQAF